MIPSTKSEGVTVTSATPGEATSQSAFKKYGIGGAKLVGLAVLFTVISIGVDSLREAIFHTKLKAELEADEKNAAAREDLASKITSGVANVVVEKVGKGIADEVVKGLQPQLDGVKGQLIEMNGHFVDLGHNFNKAIEQSTDRLVEAFGKIVVVDDAAITKIAKAVAKAAA